MSDIYGSSKKAQNERRRKYLSSILGPEKAWHQEVDPQSEIEYSKESEDFPWEEQEEQEEPIRVSDTEADDLLAALRASMGSAADLLTGSIPDTQSIADEPIEVGETKPKQKLKPDIEIIDDDPMEEIRRIANIITNDPRVFNEDFKKFKAMVAKNGTDYDEFELNDIYEACKDFSKQINRVRYELALGRRSKEDIIQYLTQSHNDDARLRFIKDHHDRKYASVEKLICKMVIDDPEILPSNWEDGYRRAFDILSLIEKKI